MFRLFNKRESCNLQNCKIGKHIFVIKKICLNSTRYKSYYQVLGLDSRASSKDIKSAYYELSLKFHPDKNNGSRESVDKFREITEAYEVLGNPEKRQSYDQGKNFSSNYSNSYTSKEDSYYKPYNAKRHQQPYSGRTRDFDYDEHFRQHYEKQRMYEYEYIKRRWEAEFRRRYPDRNPNEYYRTQYKQTSRSRTREDFENARRDFYEEYIRFFKNKFRVLYFFLPFWFAFLIIPFLSDLADPDKSKPNKPYHGPIYYSVRNDKNNGQSNE